MEFLTMRRFERLIEKVVKAANDVRVIAFPLRRAAAASRRRGARGACVIVLSDVQNAS